MTDRIESIWIDRQQAGADLNQVVVPWCVERMQLGEKIRARFEVLEDDRTYKQNAFYWSFVLRTISQQGVIDGIGSDEEGWHYYFKKRLLGYVIRKIRVPGSKRPVIRRELRSTTELKARSGREADPTRYMPDYLDALMAIAASEFGVHFPADRRWETWSH